MKYIMHNLNKGTKEDFVLNLLKKFKPDHIRIIEEGAACSAIVDYSDEEVAQRAVAHFTDKKNALCLYEEKAGAISAVDDDAKPRLIVNKTAPSSPYGFVERKRVIAKTPDRKHDTLAKAAYDIAFEVTWRAETPVAANPCSSGGPKSCPDGEKGKYQGYDNRWLMIDNRLAISPFTVKSAVANGVAALLGSCYRVMENKVEGQHEDLTEGTYPFGGEYKRYRVAMDNSRSGILLRIDDKTGDVEIQPVTEFYYDAPQPPSGVSFLQGQSYHIRYEEIKRRNIILKAEDISDKPLLKPRPGGRIDEVIYVGPYRFGMNLTLGPGEFHKNHYHRFCRLLGKPISGRLSAINLLDLDKQMEKVHMGVFKKLEQTAQWDLRDDKKYVGKPWHQDLTTLNPGHASRIDLNWVYYQSFNGKVTAIGKNFQFKTAYRHSETIPEGQVACRDVLRLCPRCSLFGMVDVTGSKDREAAGFKSRFKAATLINNLETVYTTEKGRICYGKDKNYPVELGQWKANGQVVSAQLFLPIMGAPKPNKRDKPVYFNNGMIRGAKQYRHSPITWEGLEQLIEETNQKDKISSAPNAMPYSHELRNYAQVCRDGMEFNGALGAENCSKDEIAALLLVLDHRIANHGFKIGLGKPFGLGSISSKINCIWIRRTDNYEWKKFDLSTVSEAPALPESLEEVQRAVNNLKKVHQSIMSLNQAAEVLSYPQPGSGYWREYHL